MNSSSLPYNSHNQYLKNKFQQRVQKITLDMGFSCPNRDGSKGYGGCTYCNNHSFNPNHNIKNKEELLTQINKGILFFDKKYQSQSYLAYFQAYTNTYAPIDYLREIYSQALQHPKIIGLVIGTRPDCITEPVLDLLEELAKKHYVSLEFGIESTIDQTLKNVNRCHTYHETCVAYKKAANRGIHLGGHLILGLPLETRSDFILHAQRISKLPIDSLKIHQLQIIKGTILAHQYQQNPTAIHLFEIDEYVEIIGDFIRYLNPKIMIERFLSESPKELLIAPHWGLKNFEFINLLDNYLRVNNITQGQLYIE